MNSPEMITAEALVSAPSRRPCVPNHTGTLGLYTLSRHVLGDRTINEVRVIDFEKETSTCILEDEKAFGARWIPGTNDVAYLKSCGDGSTELRVLRDANSSSDAPVIKTFKTSIKAWKLKRLKNGSIVFMVAAQVAPDGSIFNAQSVQPKSTGRIFDTANVRAVSTQHDIPYRQILIEIWWGDLHEAESYSLWYNMLELHDGQWTMTGDLHNLLPGSHLEAPTGLHGPGDPEGCFDISEHGVVFAAVDLTKTTLADLGFSQLYHVDVRSYAQPPTEKPLIVSPPSSFSPGHHFNVKFSPDESTIGFIYSPANQSSGHRLHLAPVDSLEAYDVVARIGRSFDDDSFDPIIEYDFTTSSDEIVFLSEKRGRTILSSLKLRDLATPQPLFTNSSVSSYYPLNAETWDKIIVCSSSFVDRSIWQVVSVSDGTVLKTIKPMADEDVSWGLSRDMVTEFTSTSDGFSSHAFVVRPSNFDEKKRYPWVLMIHGGPVAAWSDSWGAPQGYVVICPNITGSSGYGLDHARRIRGDWLGQPYRDLLGVIAHLEQLPYLDQSKGIIGGGSYGGLMISWMMGHDIIKKFCGVIWQSGIYNMAYFPLYMDVFWYDGPFGDARFPWQDLAAAEKFNPAKPELLRNWKNAPPTLVIHPEKDYRCPITEGLAAFKTLQFHGVPSRFLTFSDESHWIQKPENCKLWYGTVWDWMNRCVSGELKRQTPV